MGWLRKISLSKTALVIIFVVCGLNIYSQVNRPKLLNIIEWDVQEYYMYLPAAFIYNDLGFEFVPQLPDSLQKHYWLKKSDIGKNIGRFSGGMAITYTPFFLLGHGIAKVFGFPQNGFSFPYQLGIFISGFCYSFIGYIFLRRILLRYFNDLATALTLICISLGTNLFYYTTTEGPMSHASLFCLFTLFLYFTIKWHEKPAYRTMAMLFSVAALAVVIRPISVMLAVFFLLYNISGKNTLPGKIKFYLAHYKHFLLGFSVALLVALPQLVYWKTYGGQWLYYSYGNERFFFNDPQIINGLFGYRKGWLVYTPVMILSLCGFFFLRRRTPEVFFPILIYVILHIYVIFSWWCWWYGGSFGMRAMIEAYALLALPFAALWQYLWLKLKPAFFLAIAFSVFCIYLNGVQSLQYRQVIIHWDSMNKAYYWAVFNKLSWPDEQTRSLLVAPDYEGAMAGKRD